MPGKLPKKNFKLIVSALLLNLLICFSSAAEPYEATLLKERSLKYINTFGFFYDTFDYFIIPRLTSEIEKNTIITNLTNLKSPETLQVGYGKQTPFGSLSFYFDIKGYNKGGERLQQDLQYLDKDKDGFYEYAEAYTYYTKEKYDNGQYFNSPAEKNLDITAGLSYGKKVGNFIWGIGGAYKIQRLKEDYTGIGEGLTDFYCPAQSYALSHNLCTSNYYPFEGSPLEYGELRKVNLLTSTYESISEKEIGDEKSVYQEFSASGGVSLDVSGFYTLSMDAILGLGKDINNGEGTYSYSHTYSTSLSWETLEYLENVKKDYWILRSGIALKNQFTLKNGVHTLYVDLGYERITHLNDTINKTVQNQNISISPSLNDSIEESGTVKGKDNSGSTDTFIFSIRDLYYINPETRLGYGMEFTYLTAKSDIKYQWTYQGLENYSDRDNQTADPDDFSSTSTASIPVKAKDISEEYIISFPVVFVTSFLRNGEILIGARFLVNINKTVYEHIIDTNKNLNLWERTTKYGDGRIEENVTSSIPAFPGSGNKINFAEKRKVLDISTNAEINAGVGYSFFKDRFKLSLLFTTGISDAKIPGQKISFAEAHLSAIITF